MIYQVEPELYASFGADIDIKRVKFQYPYISRYTPIFLHDPLNQVNRHLQQRKGGRVFYKLTINVCGLK